MAGIEFADVAAKLSCEEFAQREMQLKRGRARCPFHGGEHFNLQFFKDGHCHCHVCHRTADVVQLAAAVWGTNQLDAARMLNNEYNLGLTDSTPTDEQRQQRQRERDRREADARRARETWSKAAVDLREAEQAAAGFTINDADNPATWAAVARLGKAQDQWHAMQACCAGVDR